MSGGDVSISQLQQSRFAMSMFPLSTTLHSSVGSRAAALDDDKNAKHIAQDTILLKWRHRHRERTGGGGLPHEAQPKRETFVPTMAVLRGVHIAARSGEEFGKVLGAL